MTLVATGVTVRFGGQVALDDVAITVEPGRIQGLIGPNGSGKTTLFNVCSGFQAVKAGKVLLDDRDVTSVSAVKRARLGISRTFQRMQLFTSMSCLENVLIAAETAVLKSTSGRGLHQSKESAKARAEDTLAEVGLGGFEPAMAGDLSTGQGRLLELARALVRRPRYLLLDEPSSGLDMKETRQFGELLSNITRTSGVGVLLIEHDMELVLRIAARVSVLTQGRVLAEGTPREIGSSEEVRAAYLGSEVESI